MLGWDLNRLFVAPALATPGPDDFPANLCDIVKNSSEYPATSESLPAHKNPADVTATTVHCNTCRACCCKLEVMLMGEDNVPARLTQIDRWGGHVMARREDGWCAALDRTTLLCRIYKQRPGVCRDYPVGEGDCLTERTKASL